MKEHPIIFSGPIMVRAIRQGFKRQTRRICKGNWLRCLDLEEPEDLSVAVKRCPYGASGDRLWVRETWYYDGVLPDQDRSLLYYRADGEPRWEGDGRTPWKPSIHMPRWASRTTLEVTNVRVERLQGIKDDDVYAEGIPEEEIERAEHFSIGGSPLRGGSPERCAFASLWDLINSKRASWDSNPVVWVISFRPALCSSEEGAS